MTQTPSQREKSSERRTSSTACAWRKMVRRDASPDTSRHHEAPRAHADGDHGRAAIAPSMTHSMRRREG